MSRKKTARAKSAPEEPRRWTLGGPRLSVGLTAGIVLAAILLPSLMGRATEGRFEVDARQLAFDLEPRWLEEPARIEVEAALAGLGSVSLRDDDAIEEWLDGLEQCSPWIGRVTSAQKQYPDCLKVAFDLRRPVARLQTRSGRILLDNEGVALGPEALSPGFVEHDRPLVLYRRGVIPNLSPGESLQDPALRAGLEVIKELNQYLGRLRREGCDLVLVDVSPLAQSEPGRRTDVTLFTSDGWFVEWGRARSMRADEPSAETKIHHLLFLRENSPPFEDVLGYCVQFHSRRHVSLVRVTGEQQVASAGTVADTYGAPAPPTDASGSQPR